MVAERPMGEPSRQKKSSPAYQEIMEIKKQIETLLSRMEKDGKFCPSRDTLDGIGEQMIHACNRYHATIALWDKYLKAAIIDVTEVPIINAPELQRVSFRGAMQDAVMNLEQLLSGDW